MTSTPTPGVCHDGRMETYIAPKLEGRKVPLKLRVRSEVHRAAWHRAQQLNMSIAEYADALIARDNGLPSAFDDIEGVQTAMTFPKTA